MAKNTFLVIPAKEAAQNETELKLLDGKVVSLKS